MHRPARGQNGVQHRGHTWHLQGSHPLLPRAGMHKRHDMGRVHQLGAPPLLALRHRGEARRLREMPHRQAVRRSKFDTKDSQTLGGPDDESTTESNTSDEGDEGDEDSSDEEGEDDETKAHPKRHKRGPRTQK